MRGDARAQPTLIARFHSPKLLPVNAPVSAAAADQPELPRLTRPAGFLLPAHRLSGHGVLPTSYVVRCQVPFSPNLFTYLYHGGGAV